MPAACVTAADRVVARSTEAGAGHSVSLWCLTKPWWSHRPPGGRFQRQQRPHVHRHRLQAPSGDRPRGRSVHCHRVDRGAAGRVARSLLSGQGGDSAARRLGGPGPPGEGGARPSAEPPGGRALTGEATCAVGEGTPGWCRRGAARALQGPGPCPGRLPAQLRCGNAEYFRVTDAVASPFDRSPQTLMVVTGQGERTGPAGRRRPPRGHHAGGRKGKRGHVTPSPVPDTHGCGLSPVRPTAPSPGSYACGPFTIGVRTPVLPSCPPGHSQMPSKQQGSHRGASSPVRPPCPLSLPTAGAGTQPPCRPWSVEGTGETRQEAGAPSQQVPRPPRLGPLWSPRAPLTRPLWLLAGRFPASTKGWFSRKFHQHSPARVALPLRESRP